MKNNTKDAKVQEIISMLSKLYISLDRRDPIHGQIDVLPTATDVERWLEIEADEEIRGVIVEDDLRGLQISDRIRTGSGNESQIAMASMKI